MIFDDSKNKPEAKRKKKKIIKFCIKNIYTKENIVKNFSTYQRHPASRYIDKKKTSHSIMSKVSRQMYIFIYFFLQTNIKKKLDK